MLVAWGVLEVVRGLVAKPIVSLKSSGLDWRLMLLWAGLTMVIISNISKPINSSILTGPASGRVWSA